MKKEKKLIISIILIFTLFSIASLYKLYTYNVNNINKSIIDKNNFYSKNSASLIESSSNSSLSIIKNFNFTLTQGTIGNVINTKVENYNFISSISDDSNIIWRKTKLNSVLITSPNFNIVMYLAIESQPIGLNNPIPENVQINNNFNKIITRVEYKLDEIKQTFMDYNINNLYLYYYTDSFKKGLDCKGLPSSLNNFCGGDDINLKGIKNHILDANMKIYCGVDNKDNIKYCDDFVKNLTVN